MEKALHDYIMDQRAEAEEFSKQPGCWMGMMVHPSDTDYWNERVPSGTLAEFQRIELEESAYYAVADAYSKSLARSYSMSTMTDAQLNELIEDACHTMERDAAESAKALEQEEARLNKLAADMNVDRVTLDRWLDEDYPAEVFQPANEQPEYEVY